MISLKEIEDNIKSKEWRLENLYYILDVKGQKIKFKPNWAQLYFFNCLHSRNIILKARQLGLTTLACIDALDDCLFTPNFKAGIIAHNREDAHSFFEDKVQFAYDNLPSEVRNANPATTDRAGKLAFANGSSIRVATSFRSGTLQRLHVSEFGKICAKYPAKAKEIITGALNAVHTGMRVDFESTAEGRQGKFFELCQIAENLQISGGTLTDEDFKFFFFPWFKHPGYRINSKGVQFTQEMQDYFSKVESETGVKLDTEQRAWYVKKFNVLGPDMKQEFPSTPKEAFEQTIDGAYFASQFRKIRETGRICSVPIQEGVKVDTYWDLGMNDVMAIWFVQVIGRECRFVDYYENSGEGLAFYARILSEKKQERDLFYGEHYGPHDLNVRELGTGISRFNRAKQLGINFVVVPRVGKKADAIEASRNAFSLCWFDEKHCSV
ncbi:MAG: hypothetical protein BA863_08090, partial [Desulfovibrio sp. S3730MH75]